MSGSGCRVRGSSVSSGSTVREVASQLKESMYGVSMDLEKLSELKYTMCFGCMKSGEIVVASCTVSVSM